MLDADRRPTAQEIEELIDLVRRDPGSPVFIDLGEAYLQLGRPRDAVQIATMGLSNAPDNLEARVLLARAYIAQHQWREAQGELLRVVKVDRGNRLAFALLGEVLLRRSDFERAVPVLQHAQNLDPTSPQLLAMLRRARAGQTLDPPGPIPQPMPPRGETDHPVEIERSAASRQARAQAPAPTPVPPPAQPRRSMPMQAAPAPAPTPVPPRVRSAAQPRPDQTEPAPPPIHVPTITPAELAAAPVAPQPPRASRPSQAYSTGVPDSVRPRVVSAAKPQNAAAASLRQSAAVGENYLNELLTGGLLAVPGVRVPDVEYDLRPDRRWGRSTRRAFIFLFVVLVLAIGGGGTTYWWTEKQKAEAIRGLQADAKAAIGQADLPGLEAARKKLSEANERDNQNTITLTYVVENAGLEALLYGKPPDGIAELYASLKKDVQPTDPGERELVIGKAALVLARLGVGVQAKGATDAAVDKSAVAELADTAKSLDDYLVAHADDNWALWLKGRAQLAAGARGAAKATLKKASDGEGGLVVAMVDLADITADDGALADAVALYDRALKKAPNHTLAVLGLALARAEAGVDAEAVVNDVNVSLGDKDLGGRVNAYRALALGFAELGIEDYAKAGDQLRLAQAAASSTDARPPMPVIEPRFWAGLAWADLLRGELAAAASARALVTYYGRTRAEEDPLVATVDAGFLLAAGRADQALDKASRLAVQSTRARLVKTFALLELAQTKDAVTEADALVAATAPKAEGGKPNLTAQILDAWAKLAAAKDAKATPRPGEPGRGAPNGGAESIDEAAKPLESLSHSASTKLPRHALGMAYVALGDHKNALTELQQAVADLDPTRPNPVAYRSHTALAELLIDDGKLDDAAAQLDASHKANPNNVQTMFADARLALRKGDADAADGVLAPALKDVDKAAIPASVQLMAIEIMATKKAATQDDKDKAAALLPDLKDKVAPAELGRVAALIDPKLPEKLGVPAPPPDPNAPATAAPPTHHHH